MITNHETDLNQLNTKQKFYLQELYKKRKRGEVLNNQEQDLVLRFSEQWTAAEKRQRSMLPFIGILIVIAVLRVIYNG